jgi:hypothetical protein
MKIGQEAEHINDFKASFLRSRIAVLIDLLRDLEEGNHSHEYSDENIKCVIKDLSWFRRQYYRPSWEG